MELVFNRPNTAEEQITDPEIVLRRGHGASSRGVFIDNGFWEYESDSGVITITFRPAIYLSNALSPTELEQVRAHEQGHMNDYLDLTAALHEDLQAELHASHEISWEDMQARWFWYNYDVCVAEGRYHRSVGQDARQCSRPSEPCPAWSQRTMVEE